MGFGKYPLPFSEYQKMTKLSKERIFQLVLAGITTLIAGISGSLLSSFYSKVALSKGVSVSDSGHVFGSKFLTVMLISIIHGKYLGSLYRARSCLIIGLIICFIG